MGTNHLETNSLTFNFPEPHFSWPIITDEMKTAVLETMDAGFSVSCRMKVCQELEENFRSHIGTKYAVAVNSGTAAILSMLDGIGIQKGDEVIVPTYTFFATASPMLILGGIPIFADCDSDGNIDPNEIRRKISPRTKAIVVTHQWGIPCDMDEIVEICKIHNLKLLEDCSRAHGGKYKGKNVGTFGDAAAFSLQTNKLVSGVDGGVMITNDDTIYYRTLLLGVSMFGGRTGKEIPRDHPFFRYHFAGFGLNHRIHPLGAVIANQQLSHLDEFLAQKRIFVQQFEEAVTEIPFLEPPRHQNKSPAWYVFVMQFQPEKCTVEIEEFLQRLHDVGLSEFVRPGPLGENIYDLPIFTNPQQIWPETFKDLDLKKQGPFPMAQKFIQNAIKVPVWVRSSDQDIVSIYIKGLLQVAKTITK